ncbi:MAG: YceI family protein [Deltaproteobacteria bacterium]|nr:YceI family protein [Deltaproteobacteria bacterium]
MRVDATTAECRVLTYKEGLLSAVAHDLEIRVTAFTITIDETAWRVEARFDATSLRVVGAVRDGVVDPRELSASDQRTIEGTIVRDVLDASRYPEIRFVSEAATGRGDVLAVRGRLDLHGHTRDVTVMAHRESPSWVAEARLHQPDFGIRPYSAMLGTLRVRADVVVRVTIPLPIPG